MILYFLYSYNYHKLVSCIFGCLIAILRQNSAGVFLLSPEVTGTVVEDVKLYTEVVDNEETVGARENTLSLKRSR